MAVDVAELAIKIDSRGAIIGVRSLRGELGRTERAAKGFNGAMQRTSRSLKRGDASARHMIFTLGKMLGSIFAITFAIKKLGEAAAVFGKAAAQLEALEIGMRAATGSAQAAGAEFEFVRNEAKRLGLDINELSKQYTLLAAATKDSSLEGFQTRKIFTSVAQAARVLQMSNDNVAGSFRALVQMVSKGNVQAEELRGQFGERMPGAFQMAADAMGVTVQELNKLLETGQVTAVELLPGLSDQLIERYGKDLPDALETARTKIGQFETALFELQATIGEIFVLPGITRTAIEATDALEQIQGALDIAAKELNFFAEEGAQATFDLATAFRENIEYIISTIQVFSAAGQSITILTKGWGLAAKELAGTAILLERAWRGLENNRLVESIGVQQTVIDQVTEKYKNLTEAVRLQSKVVKEAEYGTWQYDQAKSKLEELNAEYSNTQQRLQQLVSERNKDTVQANEHAERIKFLDKAYGEFVKDISGAMETLRNDTTDWFEEMGQLEEKLGQFADALDTSKARAEIRKQTHELGILVTTADTAAERQKRYVDWVMAVRRAVDQGAISAETAAHDFKVMSGAMDGSGKHARTPTEALKELMETLEASAGKLDKFEQARKQIRALAKTDIDPKLIEDALERVDELDPKLSRLEKISEDFGKALSESFEDAILEGKGVIAVLEDMDKWLARLIVRQTITNPLEKAATSFVGNLFGGAGGGEFTEGSSSFVGPLRQSAMGNVLKNGNIVPFANGGVVGSPTLFPMRNGTGLMGEAGPEAIMPLARLSSGDLGVKSEGSGGTTINQHFSIDARGAEAGSEQRIQQAVAEGARRGYQMVASDVNTNGPIRRSLRV